LAQRGGTGLARPLVLAASAAFGVLLLAAGMFSAVGGRDDGPESASPPSRHDPKAAQPGADRSAGPRSSAAVRFTVEANGDLLIHSPIFERALSLGGGRRYDFAPMLRRVRRYVSGADLAICHVETPMTPRPPRGYPVFNTPPALARAIRSTGWDVCDTASNHSLDQGQYGIDATTRALDRAGVAHTGSFRSPSASRRTLVLDVKGVKVAFLAYTEMTNGIPLPNPWSLNLATSSRILRDARRARRRGADAVIVNIHWGTEYQHAPSAFQTSLARALTKSHYVTIVIGQHVHVVQPIRRLHQKFVVFGEGNLLSNQTAACCPPATQDGLMALIDFVADARGVRVADVRYVPVWVRHPDFVVLPVGSALRRGEANSQALRASYRSTVSVAGRSRHVQPIPARLPR
jgi:Bacterial capsule synthesis protein PGA_cap